MVGRIARRLEDYGVSGDHRGRGHAAQNRQRKIPGRNYGSDAKRDVAQGVTLTGKLNHRLRLGEVQCRAGVKLAEVDRFAGIGFGFVPIFPGFERQPGIELEFPFSQDLRDAEDQAGALLRRNIFPGFESRKSGLHRGLDLFMAGFLVDSDDFGGTRRIDRADLLCGALAFTADYKIVFTAELAANLGDRIAHCAGMIGVLGTGETDNRFIPEFAYP